MRISFLINPTDDWQQAVEHSRQLVLSAMRKHHITAVFFFGSAAHILQHRHQQHQWKTVKNVQLWICRTMVDQLQLNESTCTKHFSIVGLAPWVNSMEQSDRIVEIT